jgi:hypothetical protein
MTRGRAHPPELRASAEALLLAGHSQAQVCETTGLPRASVSDIAAGLGDKFVQARSKKVESDGELLMNYFRGVLRALTAQTEVFGDPDYCRGQDADKLAIAHGILGDKLAGIATTAQALGLIGTAPAALPEPTDPTITSFERVDATSGAESDY